MAEISINQLTRTVKHGNNQIMVPRFSIFDEANPKHFVYRHIRLDKNEPFYIGIGTQNPRIQGYHRAKTNSKRNGIWLSITEKTDHRVEILFESNDYNEILEKEVEFINLYGRIKIGTGTLANLGAGGQSVLIKNASKNKKSSAMKGKKHSIKTLHRMSKSQSKPVYQYGLDGKFIKEWYNKEAAETGLNSSGGCISRACKRANHYSHHSYWYEHFQGDVLKQMPESFKSYAKPIIAIKISDNTVTEYKNASVAAVEIFGSQKFNSCLNYPLAKEGRTYKGYIFKYK